MPAQDTPQSTGFDAFVPVEAPTAMTVPFDPSAPPPFIDRTQLYSPQAFGVLKISNIPFNLTMAEAQQFICKHIHVDDLVKPHVEGFPIHIIMERSTGKTMDCYVETIDQEAAAQAFVRSFDPAHCRNPKLGQRHVTVELSDQCELMQQLFPRARCIMWQKEQNGAPKRVQNMDGYSRGFTGFFTNEEMNGVVRHAETPQRSPFAMRSYQRTYESMISTLYKFPWHSTALYKMSARDVLFKTYFRQLEILVLKCDAMNPAPREVGLDNKLLMDFVFAGMNCCGFSERQRAEIVQACSNVGPGLVISAHARYWPFQTLAANPPGLVSDQDIAMWLNVLNLGMAVLEGEGQGFIGIDPWLKVLRDDAGYIQFSPTKAGSRLTRQGFARLETKMMGAMLHKGWQQYTHQLGLDPPPSPTAYHWTTDDEHSSQGSVDDDAAASLSDSRNSPPRRSAHGDTFTESGDAIHKHPFPSYSEVLRTTREERESLRQVNIAHASFMAGSSDGGGRGPVLGPGLELSGDLGNGLPQATAFTAVTDQPFALSTQHVRPALDNAVADVSLGDGFTTPQRPSTGRRATSVTIPTAPHALEGRTPAISGFDHAEPQSEPARLTRRLISITSPDGTPSRPSSRKQTTNMIDLSRLSNALAAIQPDDIYAPPEPVHMCGTTSRLTFGPATKLSDAPGSKNPILKSPASMVARAGTGWNAMHPRSCARSNLSISETIKEEREDDSEEDA